MYTEDDGKYVYQIQEYPHEELRSDNTDPIDEQYVGFFVASIQTWGHQR